MADSNLPPPLVITSDASYTTEFHAALYSLQQSASLTDFTIRSGCASIACHRVVLAAASPYFSAMFTTELSESNKGEVALEDIDIDSLKMLVEYMYTGTVSVEYNNVKNFVCAADYLLLPLVKKRCKDYLIEHLNVKNCIMCCKVGTLYGLADLVGKAKELMRRHFKTVVESEEFVHLSLAELVDYITMNDLDILNDDLKLVACLDWIKHDQVERKQYFDDLLKHITIENASISFLSDMIQQNKDIITEATVNQMSQYIVHHLGRTEYGSKPKYKENQNTYIILLGGDNSSDRVQNPKICDSMNYSWKNLASFPNSCFLKSFNMCILDGGILVTGGHIKTSLASKDGFYYNVTFNVWMKVSDMLTSRYDHGSVAFNKHAYVLGGRGDDESALRTVELFDMVNDRWRFVEPMLHAPGSVPIVARCGHQIYVILSDIDLNASITEEHGLNMQIYDTVRDKWTLGPALPEHITSSFGASAITYNDDIYLLGGLEKICSKFSTKTLTWSSLSTPQHIQNCGPAIFFSGKIHILGGSSGDNWEDYSDTISEYDIEADVWKVLDYKCPYKSTGGIALVMSKPANYLDKF